MLISIPEWDSSKRSSQHFNDCTSSELLIIISLSTSFEFPVNFAFCVLQWNTFLLVCFGLKKKLEINVRKIKTWSYLRGRDWLIAKELNSHWPRSIKPFFSLKIAKTLSTNRGNNIRSKNKSIQYCVFSCSCFGLHAS